ncbi:hypothetical protein ACK3TF_005802 [Chlorella vulgaris]
MKLAFVILALALAGSASANVNGGQAYFLTTRSLAVAGFLPSCDNSVMLSEKAVQALAKCINENAGEVCCRAYDDIVGYACSVEYNDAMSEALTSMITALEVGTGLSAAEEDLANALYDLGVAINTDLTFPLWDELTLNEKTDLLAGGVIDVEEQCPYLKGATSGASRLEVMVGLGFVLTFGAYVFM